LEELERAVMEALLAGDDPRLAALRKQYATATVRDRQFSGVGFFTDFQVQASIEKATPSNFELGDHFLLVGRLAARGRCGSVRPERRN
jgi:hypothetical protein